MRFSVSVQPPNADSESPRGRRIRSIYVHSPFCRRRCPYCDFAIAILRSPADAHRFIEGLTLELDALGSHLAPRTLYVGGGTPSRLAPADLDRFFAVLRDRIALHSVVEFTVEANPEDISRDRVAILREHGVTRVSLGAQSLDPSVLRDLGRKHSPKTVELAVGLLRDAGIESINVDLIYAVPGQSLGQLSADLHRFIRLATDHVSAYCLTYEDRTPFQTLESLGRLTRQTNEEELLAFRLVRETLGEAGFDAYEVSNFAKRGHESLHNLTYWNNEEYLGVGPSAVSCRGRVRSRNLPQLEEWHAALMGGHRPVHDLEVLSPERTMGESLAVGLRLAEGVSIARIERRAGIPLDAARRAQLDRLSDLGVLVLANDRVRLTARGREVADSVAAQLI